MQKFMILLGCTSAVAFLFPSAFQDYRHRMDVEQRRETVPTGPAIIEAASPPPSAPQAASGRNLQLKAETDGHFRSEARINGRPVDVLVDTGATYVALSESVARRLGVSVAPADFRYTAQTANGAMPVAIARLKSVRLGAIEVRDVEAMVARGDAMPITLLGMSFLGKLKRFEVKDGTLNLVP